MGEAWGFHFGQFLTIQEFGNNNRQLSLNAFENFDPWQRPRGDGVDKFVSSWRGWMPCGIMHDLMDTNADLVRSGFRDNASGYTIKNIYDALDSGIESLECLILLGRIFIARTIKFVLWQRSMRMILK